MQHNMISKIYIIIVASRFVALVHMLFPVFVPEDYRCLVICSGRLGCRSAWCSIA